MAMVDRPGRFKARIITSALQDKNNKPQMAIEFGLLEMYENGQWIDWQEYGMGITGYFFPFKNDGTPNEKTIELLMKSLGWDGTSLASLAEDDKYAGNDVQIVVKEDVYNGQKKLKVAWMDPADWQPGLKPTDKNEVKVMSNTWDAKLRALNGGKTNPAAKAAPPKATASR